ncbi:hypothetical protein O181_021244 [Austropuccinia psidii MF-1]|uniref:Reverse transcriptase domain-containing protein n=1 Tax=Austropuccinia psidii MF-1 TaxID=1389203 RepID=A0A9Q3CAG0_9BASI|nr:hypothetical protein [Austropuccinia psidii MF-1]
MTVCIESSQKPLIIDSRAHFSIVARDYLDHHFPNWKKKLLPTKAKNLKSASGKMTSIGTIIKEMIIHHRKGNIRPNPNFVVLEDVQIQGFLLGADYQRMYGIDIYNSKNRNITIGKNKEKKFSLEIYQISIHDPLEQFLNGFKEGQFSTNLTSKQKLSLMKMLRRKRPAFAIGEEPLGKIRGHDIELYLDVERPYPPMLRIPPCPESLETRKEIEKHVNEVLHIDVIRKIGHNEIVEITTPVLITCNNGKSRLCGDFRALNNYKKADRYSIPRIAHALEKLGKAKYINKRDCMKGFHQIAEVYTDYKAFKSLWMMKTTNRHMLRWQIAIQKYRGNMTIIYKEGKSHTITDGLSRWPIDNVKRNTAYYAEVAAKIPIYFMEIDRRKNFRYSEWEPGSGTPDCGNTESEETENPILGICSLNCIMSSSVK